jgi:uncharacterized membrane protein
MSALDELRWLQWSYGADSGTFAQLITDTFGGMRDGIEQGTHFRFHWSPTLALLWPLMALTHSVMTLQLVQIAATVTVAPLAYALILPRAGRNVALRFAILTLVYPPLLAIGWGEFHEVGFFAPIALGLVVSADRKAWRCFSILAILACGIREDVTLELAIIGLLLAFSMARARRAWMAVCLLAVASDAVYYAVIIPRVGPWNPVHFYVYQFARGPLAVVISPFTHPLEFAHEFLTFGRLTYVIEALAPLGALPFYSPWSLLSLPGFGIVLLANSGLVYHMGNHYASLWSPWLIVGGAFAATERRVNVALAISLLVLVFFNPLHPAHFLKQNYHDLLSAKHALACVPPGASIATHDEWFTQIAATNPRATLSRIEGVDYLVFADDFPNDEFQRVWLPRIHDEVRSGAYREICRYGAVVTYERSVKK